MIRSAQKFDTRAPDVREQVLERRPARAIEFRRHSLAGPAGWPMYSEPSGMSLFTPALAPTLAPAPIVTLSATPTCPPSITPSPSVTEPASMVPPHSTQQRPMRLTPGLSWISHAWGVPGLTSKR